MTVEPRIVEVRVNYTKEDADYDQATKRFAKMSPKEEGEVFPLFSLTPVPAALQVCREARGHLGEVCYERAFGELSAPEAVGVERGAGGDEERGVEDGDEDEEGLKLINLEHPGPGDGEEDLENDDNKSKPITEETNNPDSATTPRRYVWLNFQQDMLSLGPSLFKHFLPYTSKIRALRFQRALHSSKHGEEPRLNVDNIADLRLISNFTNIEELHIICAYGQDVDDWAGVETELEMKFPIPRWQVLVIAHEDDLVVDAYGIDIYEKDERENTLKALRSGNGEAAQRWKRLM